MVNKVREFFKGLLTEPEYSKIREIFLFILITVIIHFAWRFWERQVNYFPVREWMTSAVYSTTTLLFRQTAWIFQHLLHISFRPVYPVIWFDNAWGLSVNEGCTGFKQIAQFMLLILFFPGSWKNKAWFIPAGMIIVYLTNLFRIVVLGLTLNYHPQYHNVVHDYVLRALFYVVIFILWLLWVNKVGAGGKQEIQKPA